jgi:CheY-like chemotaxis protein
LVEVLELAGATVRDASSAVAAMQTFDRFVPDLLVCDIAMPVEDGCSLLRRIRPAEKSMVATCVPPR